MSVSESASEVLPQIRLRLRSRSEHCDALGCATAAWETVAKPVILRDPFGLRAKVKCGPASAGAHVT